MYSRHSSHTFLNIQLVLNVVMVALTILLLTTRYYTLAFLPLVIMLAGIAITRWPQFGIYGMVFLIPFGAYKRIPIGSFELNLSWVFVGASLLVLLADRLVHKKPFKELNTPIVPWLGLFLIVLIVSTWLSPFLASSLNDLKLWIAAFIYILLMIMVLPEEGYKTVIPNILIFSVFLSSLLGNLGYVFNLSGFTDVQMGGQLTRNIGGALDPNNLSLMLIATLPLILYRLTYAKSKAARILYLVVILNHVISIGLTFSRGGFLIFILILLFLAFEYRHYFKAKYIGFVLMGFMLFAGLFTTVMPDKFWQRQSSFISWEDSSLIRRASYIIVASDAFLERPLLGFGPDSFYQLYAETDYARLDKLTGIFKGRYAHNSYIEILIGTGVIGLSVFLIIMFKTMRAFTMAKLRYLQANLREEAFLISSMRMYFLTTLIYLFVFSETHHKFLLVGIAMSQLALRFSKEALDRQGVT